MFSGKGPAIAGLFFVLSLNGGLTAEHARLSLPGQQHFRSFIEIFTPLVLKREKNGSNYRWGHKNRDCAGLVRYLFWEALEKHNDTFLAEYPELSTLASPGGVESVRISREWAAGNHTASELKSHSRFLGRNPEPRILKTGDLFYFESSELKIRHVMLVLRSGSSVYLVYHTGDARNELRIRSLEDLRGLAEFEWHPEAANPVFRGLFRPSFLD